MRTIKFRGKSIETNEWVHGFYYEVPAPLKCVGKREEPKGYIIKERPNTVNDWGMPIQMVAIEVARNTICRYTGLKDCNGKEVYESDIIESPLWEDEPYEIVFKDYAFKARDIRKKIIHGSDLFFDIDDLLSSCAGETFKVIGDIYDNPELIGGK
ncbi:YopX family protein [Clostridium sp. B9]|uniref:YopX family protein n=1 Tax=Clostridium sp. B9 TaxID=3423224 RepID=UPI003D2EA376